MKEAKSRAQSKNRGRDAPDMRLVGIDFNPGPDAEDRLRRLFTILVRLVGDDLPLPSAESLADRSSEENG